MGTRDCIDAIPAAVVAHHVDDGTLHLNGRVRALLDTDERCLALPAWLERFAADPASSRDVIAAARTSGSPVDLALRTTGGETRVVALAIGPVSASPSPTELWTLADVTDARREHRLMERTQRAARIGGWELDFVTDRLYWTAETFRINDTSPEEFAPTVATVMAMLAPASIPIATRALEAMRHRGEPLDIELQVRTRRGRELWVHVLGTAEREAGRVVRGYGSFQDISDRVHAASELKRALAGLELAQRRARIGHFELDARTEHMSWSRQLFQLVGRDERLGSPTSVAEAIEHLHPDDRARAARAAQTIISGRRDRIELEVRTNPEPGPIRHLAAALYAEVGHGVRRLDGIVMDVTAQREHEQEMRRLQEQLDHAARLEILGGIAGGIAHDFNSLLVAVLGNASLALDMLGDRDAVAGCLEDIERAAERAAHLCRQLLAYAGNDHLIRERIDLSMLVHEQLPLLAPSGDQVATVALELDEHVPPVDGEPAQLRQLLRNLVTNAMEAASSVVSIETGVARCDEEMLAQAYGTAALPPGRYVYLRVRDDGSGIPAEIRDRVFEPFVSTKFTGRGLGLAAVAGIVRDHGAGVLIDSAPGAGTSFTVLLPPAAEARTSAPRLRGDGMVLVVDDESLAQRMVCSVLERAGFEPLPVSTGPAALDALRGRARDARLVVMDLMMPDLSGQELLRAMQPIAPEVPVLVVSGMSERRARRSLGDVPIAGFVQKPFTPRRLLHAVQRAIHGTATQQRASR